MLYKNILGSEDVILQIMNVWLIIIKFIFVSYGQKLNMTYHKYCYKSIMDADRQLQLWYLKFYGEPPKNIAMAYIIAELDNNEAIERDTMDKIFLQRSTGCTNTLIITNYLKDNIHRAYYVEIQLYSGNEVKSFSEIQFKFGTKAVDGLYEISGGNNIFKFEVRLQRRGKRIYAKETIKQFPNYITSSNIKESNNITLCLAFRAQTFGITVHVTQKQKKYFQDLTSVKFFCENNPTVEYIKLSAWTCNYLGATPSRADLIIFDQCEQNQVKITTTNIKGIEYTANVSHYKNAEDENQTLGIIKIENMLIITIYDIDVRINDVNKMYAFNETITTGKCKLLDNAKFGKVTIVPDVHDNEVTYLWYMKTVKDDKKDVTSYIYTPFENESQCNPPKR